MTNPTTAHSGRDGLVVLIPSLEMGGTERQILLLAQGIVSGYPEVATRTLVITMWSGGAFEKDLPSSIRLIHLGHRRSAGPITVLRLVRVLHRERPTVIYSVLAPANLLSAATSPFIRARRVWGQRSEHYSMGAPQWKHRMVRALLFVGGHRCDGVIVNSEAAERYIRSIPLREVPVKLVPNAINSAEFHPDPVARAAGREELGLVADDRLLLAVGRLVPDKDHKTLLRAFGTLAADPHLKLAIVGGGTNAASAGLFELAMELGFGDQFVLLGPRSDMNRWYNAADLLVQSSKNEGQSNVLLEALAAGCRAISTDSGDAARLLPSECVVPIGDHEALAAAVRIHFCSDVAGPSPSTVPRSIDDLTTSTLNFLGVL